MVDVLSWAGRLLDGVVGFLLLTVGVAVLIVLGREARAQWPKPRE